MNRENIDKIAQTHDDKVLLAKLWDKVTAAIRKNIPASTCFLSLREQEMVRFLFGDIAGLYSFGGYSDAERKMLVYLPDYLDENDLSDNAALACLRATFYQKDTLTHRDFLGALIGTGIARETIGDIITEDSGAVILCLDEIADYICDSLVKVGGVGVSVFKEESPELLKIERNYNVISATVSSLRCDSVIAAALKLSRTKASELIDRGLATHNYEIIKSSHRMVEDDDVLSVRGYGKFKVKTTGNLTKKGRVHIDILKYI